VLQLVGVAEPLCVNSAMLLPVYTDKLLLHLFNGLFSRTTWVSWHLKGRRFWILLEQEMMRWQWHQPDLMQIICTSLQTDNHASTSPVSFHRLDALPAAQPTASKHWRHKQKTAWTVWLSCVLLLVLVCAADLELVHDIQQEGMLHYFSALTHYMVDRKGFQSVKLSF